MQSKGGTLEIRAFLFFVSAHKIAPGESPERLNLLKDLKLRQFLKLGCGKSGRSLDNVQRNAL